MTWKINLNSILANRFNGEKQNITGYHLSYFLKWNTMACSDFLNSRYVTLCRDPFWIRYLKWIHEFYMTPTTLFANLVTHLYCQWQFNRPQTAKKIKPIIARHARANPSNYAVRIFVTRSLPEFNFDLFPDKTNLSRLSCYFFSIICPLIKDWARSSIFISNICRSFLSMGFTCWNLSKALEVFRFSPNQLP